MTLPHCPTPDDDAAPWQHWQGRRLARYLAVQALYQQRIQPVATDALARQFIRDQVPDAFQSRVDEEWLDQLLLWVSDHAVSLDQTIDSQLGEGWSLARLDRVVHDILRLGLAELTFTPTTATAIIIAEYLAVADVFVDDAQSKFVHAVLDKLALTRPQ